MPAFEYVAVDDHGRRQKGIISAESPRSARRELRLRDLMALDVIWSVVTNCAKRFRQR